MSEIQQVYKPEEPTPSTIYTFVAATEELFLEGFFYYLLFCGMIAVSCTTVLLAGYTMTKPWAAASTCACNEGVWDQLFAALGLARIG